MKRIKDFIEKEFTGEDYSKLDQLCREQKGKAVRVTKAYIRRLKKGKINGNV